MRFHNNSFKMYGGGKQLFKYQLKLAITLWFFAIFRLASSPSFVSCYAEAPSWRLVTTSYPTDNLVIAACSVLEYGAVGDGATDNTQAFQQALDIAGSMGGGTVFVPCGRYVIQGTLYIPAGVTLRGEWQKPEKGSPVEGTIIMAYSGRGNVSETALITMQPQTAVRDLIFWYPEQMPDAIQEYPPTIQMGYPNYFGNAFCTVKNVTFINSYWGFKAGPIMGGAHLLDGIYGSPLYVGIEIDGIADTGRVQFVDFSPDYWSGSGLQNSPLPNGAHKEFMYENATGIVLRRDDWSLLTYSTVEGYKTGLSVVESDCRDAYVDGVKVNHYFHNGPTYGLTVKNCRYGIYIENTADGTMFTKLNIQYCMYGIWIDSTFKQKIMLYDSLISATDVALNLEGTGNIGMHRCEIASGKVQLISGIATVVDCDFNNQPPQIKLGLMLTSILSDNRFKYAPDIQNLSIKRIIAQYKDGDLPSAPAFPPAEEIKSKPHKPARMKMYNVMLAPFNAAGNQIQDDTEAIQAALNQAANDGGGVVFLPPGRYKITTGLVIPSGVELAGAIDNPQPGSTPGSVLAVYGGRGDLNAPPPIRISEGAGIRALVIDYPEQTPFSIAEYPYTIQGMGKDVYAINFAIRQGYRGIDLFTYKCDNHFIEGFTGMPYNQGIKVGGGSVGGRIYNTQLNYGCVRYGYQSKWGSWANCFALSAEQVTALHSYYTNNFDFITLADCSNQILYNNFAIPAQRGLYLAAENGKGADGYCLNFSVDSSACSLYVDAIGEKGFSPINSQLVSNRSSNNIPTAFIILSDRFTGVFNIASTNCWGGTTNTLIINGGVLSTTLGNYRRHGTGGVQINNNGSFNAVNCTFAATENGVSLINKSIDARVSIKNSIYNGGVADTSQFAVFKNNIDIRNNDSGMAGLLFNVDAKQYLYVENNDNAYLRVTANHPADNSTRFEIQPLTGNTVLIKSLLNEKYLSAKYKGALPINATKDIAGGQDKFDVLDNGNGTFYLYAVNSGKYLIKNNAGYIIDSADERPDQYGIFRFETQDSLSQFYTDYYNTPVILGFTLQEAGGGFVSVSGTLANLSAPGMLIVGFYRDNALQHTEIIPAGSPPQSGVYFKLQYYAGNNKNGLFAKAFLWNDLSDMVPIISTRIKADLNFE
jgi:hypothetical protein